MGRLVFGAAARLLAMLAGAFLYIALFAPRAAPLAVGYLLLALACEAARMMTPPP